VSLAGFETRFGHWDQQDRKLQPEMEEKEGI
jgi:hypothetical protein